MFSTVFSFYTSKIGVDTAESEPSKVSRFIPTARQFRFALISHPLAPVAFPPGRVQDARYVIDTITFFAVSCPENPAFFRKNQQVFENIPRKILHILNILEKCCILEKSRKKLVKCGENSAKFSQILRNFGENSKKFSNF